MEIDKLEVEKSIQEKIKYNQIFLSVCALISLLLVCVDLSYSPGAFCLVLIASINLPNINKCKSDLANYKKGVLTSTYGEVLDIISEKHEGLSKWFVFIKNSSSNEPLEFCFSKNPEIAVGQTIEIFYTKNILLPIKVMKK